MTDLTFYDREDRPWPNARLTNAAIVGHTTETAVRLWARVYEEGTYCLLVSKIPVDTAGQPRLGAKDVELVLDSGKVQILGGLHWTQGFRFATDLTAVFDVDGLQPGTTYYYAIFALPVASGVRKDMWEVGKDMPHSFRTQDPKAAEAVFGLFSCHMPYPDDKGLANIEMWTRFGQELADARADFIIGAGDQVYTDGNSYISIWRWLKKVKKAMAVLPAKTRVEVMKSWYRDIYRGYWGHLEMRKVLRAFPSYMIWDDHEIMDGWGSYTRPELSQLLDTLWELEDTGRNIELANNMRDAAEAVYREYQHSHNPVTPAQQFDYGFTWGALGCYVLDMRGQRSYTRKSNRILGTAQFARLKGWLQSLDTRRTQAVFIVSPVPLVHASSFIINLLDLRLLGLNDDMRDAWEHETNWAERDKLLDLVFDFSQSKQVPVTFLSGDVHVGAAFRLARKGATAARVHQLTSSAITYATAPFGLLKLAIQEQGTLARKGRAAPTTFNCLHAMSRNNFGIVRTQAAGGAVRIFWDLFGNGNDAGEIVKLKRLELT
ncbi:MAG TPA: alkaline phosphatase D family protein [Burkholderiales bacterium]|nr:alkaline phosphatase D family protein [Burkholderiales bacterium]